MSTDGSHYDSGRKLRPLARLMRTFGDELISSEVVAVIELVKNAYDADATRVLLSFTEPFERGQGCVEVIDDGHGMTGETILNVWMEPATHYKKNAILSPRFKRRVTGEKGIGRFASSKLADSLEVVSRREGTNEEARAMFDWRLFDDETKYLDQIEVLWETAPPSEILPGGPIDSLWQDGEERSANAGTHGTILRMERLREQWDRNRFVNLRNALSRLIPPTLKSPNAPKFDDFEILLKLPAAFSDLSGFVEPSEVLQRPPYDLAGEIDADGNYNFDLTIQGEKSAINGRFILRNDRFPTCGPVYVELRAWDRDATGIAELARSFGSTQKDVRAELDRAAGFHVYRDGFRVLPYGEPKNDWLRLDVRRVQNPTMRLSNNQIIGFVLISADKNPGLRDQSNREGFVESQATDDIRALLTFTIAELEKRRYSFRHPPVPKEQREAKGGLFRNFGLHDLEKAVRTSHPNDKELQGLIEEAGAELRDKVEEIQQVLSRYHRLATLGSLVDTILHDGRAPLAKVMNEAELAMRMINKAKPDPATKVTSLKESLELIETQSEALATVFRRLEPFAGRKRGRPAKVTIEKIISDAFAVLGSETQEIGARVELPTTTTDVTVDAAELQEVVINLLQNSLYWLKEVPSADRKVLVEVNRPSPSRVEILFSDSGPGVPDDIKESIFEPYFSAKPDGIGLGLAISGEIVKDYYDGNLELLDVGPLPGATFRITLNKRV